MSASPDTATRRLLLRAARDTITSRLRGRTARIPDVPRPPECSGVFVTVRVDGALRGCIGFLALQGSVMATVCEAAWRAAAEDPRFLPVREEEIDALRVEITLLGPLARIEDATDFSIGVHGLVLEHNGHRGLLLPQVAVEHAWDRGQFLSGLCRKCRLPDQSWAEPGALLSRFEGVKFSEEDENADYAAFSAKE